MQFERMSATTAALAIVIALLGYSTSVAADDMVQYLADTRTLIKQRKYPEALERVTWFYDHGIEHQPSVSGVRNSFFLSDWLELAERHPPAMQALLDVRDRKQTRIERGNADCNTFWDVMAINRTLEESTKTVTAYRTLDQLQPRVAAECWWAFQSIAITQQAHDLIRRHRPDVRGQLSVEKTRYESWMKSPQDPNNQFRDSQREAYRNLFVTRSLELIEIAKITEGVQGAHELQQQALAVVDDARLRAIQLLQ